MNQSLETLDLDSWDIFPSKEIQKQAITALENGKVLFFPKLAFPLLAEEQCFLSPKIADPKSKNISYDIRSDQIRGSSCQLEELSRLKGMVQRYALQNRQMMDRLFPQYSTHLEQARTSFRPVQASNRTISPRKDDRLLHVDSFPSHPVKGRRILRFFTNVNPEGIPRVWRTGEPFHDVVKSFASFVRRPFPGLSILLKIFKITKDYRSLYDHYMMNIHDLMKADSSYQRHVSQEEILFPSGSSWIVYTDQVSHAAMSGQYLFEQTYHLPIQAMQNEEKAPIRVLENHLQQILA